MAITKQTRTVAPCPYGDGYGMTLREYFAAVAMQGALANPGIRKGGDTMIAGFAVHMADALLAELDKPTLLASAGEAEVVCPFDNRDPQPNEFGKVGIWRCKNLKDEGGTSMEAERYSCEVCGKRITLYYEDMA